MISITVNVISDILSGSIQCKSREQLRWNPTSDDVKHMFEINSVVKTDLSSNIK